MAVYTSTEGQRDLPRYFALAFHQLKKIKKGALDITLPDGRIFRVKAENEGPKARVDVLNYDVFSRLARDGDMGFSDAYLDGWWTSPYLQAFMDLVFANNEEMGHGFPGGFILQYYERFFHWLRGNSKGQARRNISYHYDLGNDFYSKWLDETMTYSSALFKTKQEDMAEAQTQKYELLCDEMGMSDGDHLLEIGCGWGGFAEYAAGTRGAQMTCLTISQEQHDFTKERMFNAGLAEKVEVIMRDYRDEKGMYDGVASIEMFEAVGEKYWPTYFNAVYDRLKPGANASLQIITISNELFPKYRKAVDFIQKHIFPGGMLPSPNALREQVEQAGMTYLKSVEFGESYSITLRRWFDAFNEAWPEITNDSFDQRFKNMWDFYLTSCASGFHYGTTDVTQMTIQRPK